MHFDRLQGYKKLGKEYRSHETVNHLIGEYLRDGLNVNSCESFFALLKRGVHGTFHHVSKQHLQQYADEFAFRWNHRNVLDAERNGKRLTKDASSRSYKQAGLSMYGANDDDVIKAAFQVPDPIPPKKKKAVKKKPAKKK